MKLNENYVGEVVPDLRQPEEYTIEEIYSLYESFKGFRYQPIYIVRNAKIMLDYEEFVY